MARFCSNCGNGLREGASFCENCGAAVPAEAAFAGTGAVRNGIPAPGFSDRVDHPEILAAVKKNRKASGIFGLFIVPLPLIGFFLYSLFSDEMETSNALLIGGIVSAVFLVFALFGMARSGARNGYEAVVVSKKSVRTYRHQNSDHNEMVTEFRTIVRTSDGKQKKITEWDGSQVWAYNYLNVGDRFRYHPQFAFPYEKYDKSTAPFIGCVSCGFQNSVMNDRCQRCGVPLLK